MEKERLVERFSSKVEWMSNVLIKIASGSLISMVCLTVADVILRFFYRPIVGTYELVSFLGAVAVGFAIPWTSWRRAHIYVDFVIARFPQKVRDVFNIVTRCIVIFLFLVIGWNSITYGVMLCEKGEVSLTLQMPYYPILFAFAISCFIHCLVTSCEMLKLLGGKFEY